MTDDIDHLALADDELDELLARSAPSVSTGSNEVQRELSVLVRATAAAAQVRPAARRTSATRGLAVGAGAVAVLFGGVTAAAATPFAPTWLAWANWTPDKAVVDSPNCAVLGLKVVPAGVGPSDSGVVVARQYLATLDVADVDYTDELDEQRASVVTGDGVAPGTTAADLNTDAELEQRALTKAIAEMVFGEVERQGFDSRNVSIEGRAEGCDRDQQSR